ncbi:MAG: aminotransferase class V-fold PLP-dependent enzyme [Planctomycetota bacterium]|nr:MAG: aminotransferase class V-fold PLP-dependent enzyme [Planctomycetota bacterium]
MKKHWGLDPEVIFLNHGSFGACPKEVLEYQQELRRRLEREPVRFFMRELEQGLNQTRHRLAPFLGADPEDLAFVPNATTGVNAVLRSLPWQPGDQILVTDHEYNACRNVADFVADRFGVEVVLVKLPFPIDNPEVVWQKLEEKLSSKTKLLLIDAITSQTALVMPLATLVPRLRERGIETLVDGAHAPGMLPLDLNQLGAAYFTGNCHKWLCTPKGAAVLWVRKDKQNQIRPTVISHGANAPRQDRSRFLLEFDWAGTHDPTAILSIGKAMDFLEGLFPGGWPALRRRNREQALAARDLLCETLQVEAPCPDSMIGFMAAVPLPDGRGSKAKSPLELDPLQDALIDLYNIQVPIISWPQPPHRLVRVSCQAYNEPHEYQALAQALPELLAKGY